MLNHLPNTPRAHNLFAIFTHFFLGFCADFGVLGRSGEGLGEVSVGEGGKVLLNPHKSTTHPHYQLALQQPYSHSFATNNILARRYSDHSYIKANRVNVGGEEGVNGIRFCGFIQWFLFRLFAFWCHLKLPEFLESCQVFAGDPEPVVDGGVLYWYGCLLKPYGLLKTLGLFKPFGLIAQAA